MKTSSSVYLFCAILSLVLYHLAPEQPSELFQVVCVLLFLAQSYFVVRSDIRKYGILNFNILFLFSFFMVTYAFPLFLIGTTMENKEGIEAYIDFNVSCKCSALCTFAISIYFWAYKMYRKKMVDFSTLVNKFGTLSINIFFFLISIILYYATITHLQEDGGVAVHSGYWYSLYLACLPLCLVLNCRKYQVRNLSQYVLRNILILIPAFILFFLYFIIGDRGLIIVSGVMMAATYSVMVKRIRPTFLIVGIIVGSLLMYAVRETRSSEASLSSGNTSGFVRGVEGSLSDASAISIFADLTGIHRELYIGYDYVRHYGLIEPGQIAIVPFYPIPLLPNVLSQALFGKSMNDIKPGMVLNDFMSYTGHGHFGIHCVIDVYMRWGLLGVVFFFYLWGYIVASITKYQKKNLMGVVLYIVLIASAISMPRQPLVDILRTYAYVIILAWLSGLLGGKQQRLSIKKFV